MNSLWTELAELTVTGHLSQTERTYFFEVYKKVAMFRLINESPNAVIRLSEVVVATVGAIFGYCDYFHVHLSYVSVEVALSEL